MDRRVRSKGYASLYIGLPEGYASMYIGLLAHIHALLLTAHNQTPKHNGKLYGRHSDCESKDICIPVQSRWQYLHSGFNHSMDREGLIDYSSHNFIPSCRDTF